MRLERRLLLRFRGGGGSVASIKSLLVSSGDEEGVDSPLCEGLRVVLGVGVTVPGVSKSMRVENPLVRISSRMEGMDMEEERGGGVGLESGEVAREGAVDPCRSCDHELGDCKTDPAVLARCRPAPPVLSSSAVFQAQSRPTVLISGSTGFAISYSGGSASEGVGWDLGDGDDEDRLNCGCRP